ncbi:MAG: transglutaminase family protein [Alphaproteobacteria bacterium]|nr:transglutaminase family protein [Alphaproteobacteria bacterium]
MLYDIALSIEYDYENPAGSSRHVVRLMPADLPGEQRLIAGSMTVLPEADEIRHFADFFDNGAAEVSFVVPHDRIVFCVTARVERPGVTARFDTSLEKARLADALKRVLDLGPASPHHFTAGSPLAPLVPEVADFARAVLTPSMSVFESIAAIGRAIHAGFAYEEGATTVDTPMIEAFRSRSGVCQDFSHIMISALRGVGIPAGYVSGFLRTLPPDGQERLEGADAMHAWVRAWCGPDMGWVEYDPTNALVVGADHIVVARGRDYADVAPVKGVMRSVGGHSTAHKVDVVPVGGR